MAKLEEKINDFRDEIKSFWIKAALISFLALPFLGNYVFGQSSKQDSNKPKARFEVVEGDTFYWDTLFVSKEGGYSIPLDYSEDAALNTGFSSEGVLEFIKKHSSKGKWTYIYSPLNELEVKPQFRGKVGYDNFSKEYQTKAGSQVSTIFVSWTPIMFQKLDFELQAVKESYKREGSEIVDSSNLTIDGIKAKMLKIIRPSIPHDKYTTHIVAYANDVSYNIMYSYPSKFRAPEDAFNKVKRIKFSKPKR